MRRTLTVVGVIVVVGVCLAAEDIPTPTGTPRVEPAQTPAVTPEQWEQQKALVGKSDREPLSQPLPRYPYAGGSGLSATQLADPPGVFQSDPSLRNSVPGPVLLPQIADVPFQPPFVSDAFVPRPSAVLGQIKVAGEQDAGNEALTDLAKRIAQFNAAVEDLEQDIETRASWTSTERETCKLRLTALAEERAALLAELDQLSAIERVKLVDLATLDRAEDLLKGAGEESTAR